MLLLKACPKCKGDVELTSDPDGDYVRCLMCGSIRYLAEASRRVSGPEEQREMRKAS
ncbi:MAG: hypothetical protein IIB27_03970 [Chloroflexi bacterium]|nr:hypothetical protein [Chloroflexota bacterium]MCH7642363.1 hypothetical protein [Chloroflexota bacterium]